jgi:hypothetical protein
MGRPAAEFNFSGRNLTRYRILEPRWIRLHLSNRALSPLGNFLILFLFMGLWNSSGRRT